MLIFRDSIKSFILDGDLLETMTNCKLNAGHSNIQDQKIIREVAEEMKFDIKNEGRKKPRDSSIVELFESPAIVASGISTKFLSSDPHELCDRLKLLLQEKQVGNNSNIFNEKTVAIVGKLLEEKSITPCEQNKFRKKINLLHTKKVKQVNVYTNVISSTCF